MKFKPVFGWNPRFQGILSKGKYANNNGVSMQEFHSLHIIFIPLSQWLSFLDFINLEFAYVDLSETC